MTLRRNTLDYIGINDAGNSGGVCINAAGDHNLFEYNTLGVGDDRFRIFGSTNVVRNNKFGYVDDTLVTGLHHIDDLQAYTGSGVPNPKQILFERNWESDNRVDNSHGMLLQNTAGVLGDQDWFVYRFNVILRLGQKNFDIQGQSNFYAYNNTGYQLLYNASTQYNEISYIHSPASDQLHFFNNTWSNVNQAATQNIFEPSPTATNVTYDYQHEFNAGVLPASPHNLISADPKFTNPGQDDLTLKSTSPLRNSAGPVTTAVGSGSNSTALTVADARGLFDGWGIADADTIRVGSSSYVKITSINYTTNVITLASPATWANGDFVNVKGSEDVGALPYAFALPYTIVNTTPINISAGPTSLTATCTNTEAIRMVEFLVDGIPVGYAYTAPYSVSWTSDGAIHAVEARAYSAWASQTLTKSDVNVAAKITSQPSTVSSNIGGSATLTVGISGYPTPTVQWYKNGVLIPGATSTSLSFPSLVSGDSGAYTASVSNQYATVVSNVANIYIGVVPPYVVAQSSGQTVTSGTDVQLTFFAGGTPPPSQQWYLNGVAIAGATGPILNLTGATRAVAGTYTNVATNSAGTVTSNPMVVTVQVPSRLANVSIRTFPGTGAQVLIAGFVTTGASKAILIRGVGPSLSQYVTSPVFADPILNLYIGSSTTPSQTNDDWGSGATLKSLFTQLGAFPLLDGSKDSVIYSTLTPNLYTAQVNGSGSGLGIAEVYDADSAENPTGHIVNLSARTQVGTGDAVLIAGFVITGDFSKQVLIRAVGPTLATYGVTGVLADPKAELYLSGGTTPIQSNDNWGGGSTLKAAFNSVGAFALPDDASKDAAMLATLAPGAYSVVVSGVNNTTGVALVEIYEMP